MNLLRVLTLFFLPFTAVHPGFNVTLGDAGLLVLIAVCAPRVMSQGHRMFLMTSLSLASVVAASTLISLLRVGTSVASSDAIQAILVFGLVVPFGWTAFRGLDARRVAGALALSATCQAVVALAQVNHPEFRLSTQPALGLGDFGSRPLGLMGNPNALGLVCSWSLPLFWTLIGRSEDRRGRWFWSFAMAITAAGGVVGLSKMALFTVPLGLLLGMLGERRRSEGVAALAAASAIGAWMLGPAWQWFLGAVRYRMESSSSLASRSEGWIEAWARFEEWALLGRGPGMDAAIGPGGVHMHNPIVGMATQFGVLSAVLFLAVKGVLLLEGVARSKATDVRLFVFVFLIAEIGLLVHPLYWIRGHYLPLMLLGAWVSRPSTAEGLAIAEPSPTEPNGV